jgi:hypothetical protein
MKDCYYDLGLHFILLDDSSQSYIFKLRDRPRLRSATAVEVDSVQLQESVALEAAVSFSPPWALLLAGQTHDELKYKFIDQNKS